MTADRVSDAPLTAVEEGREEEEGDKKQLAAVACSGARGSGQAETDQRHRKREQLCDRHQHHQEGRVSANTDAMESRRGTDSSAHGGD